MASLRSTIAKDRTVRNNWKRLQRTALDLEALRQELSAMHASRPVRIMSTKMVLQSSATNITDSTLADMTSRSRAVAVKIDVLNELLVRKRIMSVLKKYIFTEYSKELKSNFSTVAAQKSFIDVMLDKQIQVSEDMEQLITIADLVIEDIDQSGWGLKRIQETLATLSKERYS